MVNCETPSTVIRRTSAYLAKWSTRHHITRCTVLVRRMAHRKWKEIKQQPSILPGPAVPGCCLVYFHFLWAILSSSTVVGRLLGTHDGHNRGVLAFVEPLPSQFRARLYVLLHGTLDLGHFKKEPRNLGGLGIASGNEVSETGAKPVQAIAGHEAVRVYV